MKNIWINKHSATTCRRDSRKAESILWRLKLSCTARPRLQYAYCHRRQHSQLSNWHFAYYTIFFYFPFKACAPRYVYHQHQPKKFERIEPVGTCYIAKDNFREFSEYSPCRTSELIWRDRCIMSCQLPQHGYRRTISICWDVSHFNCTFYDFFFPFSFVSPISLMWSVLGISQARIVSSRHECGCR